MSREVRFGAQVLVCSRDFERERGALLLLDRHGSMACLERGQRWHVALRHGGFYSGRAIWPRCGAGTRRKV